ncbi:hypothetical protein [Burkholderia anthina]|uniref:hypothetical protein n=1 Tax=Burkholderia anthina TaxID=179879 RepID=UPI00158B016A|nr:hypothetical protein [Burkholderia anthina]
MTGARLVAWPAPNPRVVSRRFVIPRGDAFAAGGFECLPHTCRRNVKEWEAMRVLPDAGAFAPEAGEAIEFGAGEARIFAAHAEGP